MYRLLMVLCVLFCGLFTTECATTRATTGDVTVVESASSVKTSKFWLNGLYGHRVDTTLCEAHHTCICVPVRGGERDTMDQPLLDALNDLDDRLIEVQPCFEGSGEGGRKVPWTQLEWQEVWEEGWPFSLGPRHVCGVIPRCQTSQTRS